MSDGVAHDLLERIAIIGMAGRFPKANNAEQFWANIRDGVESITFFSDEELRDAGVDESLLADPNYVRAGTVLEDVESFDAALFGYVPREARSMDPQHRVFLECAWEALEIAGYDPERYQGSIGVFAGSGANTYLLNNVCANPEFAESLGFFHAMIANDKDYLATRVSYQLNLRGPAISMGTACSTSLVAIHMACQSLLSYQCDIALAGGVAVHTPQVRGYLYQDGMILSPDGHCRTFDAAAQGTVGGTGVGIVVLKRLREALADGDRIDAVILASALNNDGSAKVGYTAPSVDGQADVIATAHALAGIDADSIGYVETHGTATPLGDPIEVAGLTQAFSATTSRRGFCAIGSVKSNMGHADAAAGVAGLMKATLSLVHRQIPPSLHYTRPNPNIDFEKSPFFVNTTLREWPVGRTPRRAGVSSFGIGGTNAHVVLEEAREPVASGPSRPWQLLVLSGKTATALDTSTANLAEHLRAHPSENLADVAFTLQVGRKALNRRRAIVCRDVEAAARACEEPSKAITDATDGRIKGVAFMFPGGGAQYPNMARALYEEEPVFRDALDDCLLRLESNHGVDLRRAVFPTEGEHHEASEALEGPALGLPALFAVEYSLARLWMEWGIRPAAMIGHSLGEYTAACLADVLSLDDALALVVLRGRLFDEYVGGAMVSVPLPEAEVRELAGDDIAVAAVNGPSLCLASGALGSVVRFEEKLADLGVDAVRLKISVAAHSEMVEPILEPFRRGVAASELKAPRIPYVSNVTGTWITAGEATDPDYWVRHLRNTVRFAEGLDTLLADPDRVLLEVGPGRTLATLARRHPGRGSRLVAASLRHPHDEGSDWPILLEALGRLWAAGVPVAWDAYHRDEHRLRVRLPTYPFERKRYWVEPTVASPFDPTRSADSRSVRREQHGSRETTRDPECPTEEIMPMPPTAVAAPSRTSEILAMLKSTLGELSGIEVESMRTDATFLEMGLDSLFLTQLTQTFRKRLGIKITFRQLLEKTPTLAALTAYLDETLPPEVFAPPPTPPPPRTTEAVAAPATIPAAAVQAAPIATSLAPGGTSEIERIVSQQLQIMAQQLSILRNGHNGQSPIASTIHRTPPAVLEVPREPSPVPVRASEAPPTPQVPRTQFGPYVPINRGSAGELTPRQKRHLDEFVARYSARTQGSKRLIQTHRAHLADPRAVTGYRQLWKELVYQIAIASSHGSRMVDVDGNEYVDYTMGFGINLFGHSPGFVTDAIRAQLEKGFELGTLWPLAGRVAELVCGLTGMERVTFANTGSDAILGAIRAARTVTGRERIAMFTGGYHGMNDEVLVKAIAANGARCSVPAVPGVPHHVAGPVLVLDYDDPACLDTLRAHSSELAAVLVEPVQSRQPDVQPRDLLHGVRDVTRESGTALIFDELVTGFRLHPGGAQAWYGIDADLATYGKIMSGGMPLAAIAGKSAFMSAFDGGMWSFGDQSAPEADVTFYGGTFNRHPVSLAASLAVLERLEESGPDLQRRLNERSTRLAEDINGFLGEQGAPVRLAHCGSILQWKFAEDNKFARLFNYSLRDKGIHIWDRAAFLSTAHTEEDMDLLVRAVRETVAEMQEGELFPAPAPRTRPQRVERRSASDPSSNGTAVEHVPANGGSAVAGTSSAARGGAGLTIPLTDGQREIWFAAKMGDEASCAYNESTAVHLRGALDVAALQSAISGVIERHDALRTTLTADGNWQTAHATMSVPVEMLDLGTLDGPEREGALEGVLAAETRTPFDLETGPLVRFTIVRLDARHHVLILTVHHIVCDGRSIGILLWEIGKLYSSAATGEGTSLPEGAQASTFAIASAEWERQGVYAESEEYWVQQFADSVPVLDLPTRQPRPPFRTSACERRTAVIDGARLQSLQTLGAERGCTLFTTLLAGYSVLLHRLSGQSDMVIGIPASGQAVVEGNDFVGHGVNMLPLRIRVDSDRTFADLLSAVRQIVLDALDHQTFTFGSLIPKLPLRRDPGHVPLIEAIFNVDRKGTAPRFGELDVAIKGNPRGYANFDIGLNIVHTDVLTVELSFKTDLFDPATVERWMGYYIRLLESAVAAPETRLWELEMLGERERERLLNGFDDCQRRPESCCIHELFARQVSRTPGRVAVECGSRRVTYAELDLMANRVASALLAHGLGPEERVGVSVGRDIELVAALLGVFKAGGAYVPLDPTYPPRRLRHMLDDSGARIVLVSGTRNDGELFSGRSVVPLEHALAAELRAELPESSPERLAYVIYTSGSTGLPKGVAIEHRNVSALLDWARSAYTEAELSRVLASTSICFDLSVFEMWAPLVVGGTVVVVGDVLEVAAPSFDAPLTLVNTVPSAAAELLRLGWTPAGLAVVNLAGEPLKQHLVRQLYDAWNVQRVVDLYGPSETTTYSTFCVRLPESPERIGRPLPGERAYVLGPHRELLPAGSVGELWIGGAGVARGYLGAAELTKERFGPDHLRGDGGRLYRTGDLARWDEEGALEYLGRRDYQVKLRGFRIELGEVEEALGEHPAVRASVVVARERLGQLQLVAYVVVEGETEVDARILRRHLRERLPDYMVPNLFVPLDALPMTPNGKVDRKALPDPGAVRAEQSTYAPPSTKNERGLARIWEEVLGVERVGVYDNFFDLGGHSLLVTQAIARMRDEFGVQIPIRLMFEQPTIAGLAEAVDAGLGTPTESPIPAIVRVSREECRVRRTAG